MLVACCWLLSGLAVYHDADLLIGARAIRNKVLQGQYEAEYEDFRGAAYPAVRSAARAEQRK